MRGLIHIVTPRLRGMAVYCIIAGARSNQQLIQFFGKFIVWQSRRERMKIMGIFYSIDLQSGEGKHAGVKAPSDISLIAHEMGMTGFLFPAQKYMFPKGIDVIKGKIWLLKTCSERWKELCRTVGEGDIVLYQHPMYGARVALKYIPAIKREKGCRFIALIHDLESLRMGVQGLYTKSRKTAEISDQNLLKQFDAVICHNEHMRQYLIEKGFEPEKLVSLEIFDYLTKEEMCHRIRGKEPSLAVAGNLHPGKSGYLYEMFRNSGETKNRELTVNAYGVNFQSDGVSGRIRYQGAFPADKLPGVLKGDFGLVWDGPSAGSCVGNTGEYLRYNNPHKASLYLTSGMPVMVWEEAAIADFVKKYHVGITIRNLYEAAETISGVSDEEYSEMCVNAAQVGQKLREGYFFRRAFQECVKNLEKQRE